MLTPDKGTSQLAQGPIAHSCLVAVEKPGEELSQPRKNLKVIIFAETGKRLSIVSRLVLLATV